MLQVAIRKALISVHTTMKLETLAKEEGVVIVEVTKEPVKLKVAVGMYMLGLTVVFNQEICPRQPAELSVCVI